MFEAIAKKFTEAAIAADNKKKNKKLKKILNDHENEDGKSYPSNRCCK